MLSPIPLKTPRAYIIIIFIIWDAFTGRARVYQQIGVVYTKTGIDFRVFTTLDQKFNLISRRGRLGRTTTCVHEIMGYYVFVRSLYLYYVYSRVTNGRSLLCSVYGISTRPDGRRIDLLYRGLHRAIGVLVVVVRTRRHALRGDKENRKRRIIIK